MKSSLLFLFFILINLTLSAQCFDYHSELQNAENYIEAANRTQKKVLKVTSVEEAQKLLDKSAFQIGAANSSILLVKEYASGCDCEDGINSATNLYDAINDYKNLTLKIADSISIEKIVATINKNLNFGESIQNEISEASAYCLDK